MSSEEERAAQNQPEPPGGRRWMVCRLLSRRRQCRGLLVRPLLFRYILLLLLIDEIVVLECTLAWLALLGSMPTNLYSKKLWSWFLHSEVLLTNDHQPKPPGGYSRSAWKIDLYWGTKINHISATFMWVGLIMKEKVIDLAPPAVITSSILLSNFHFWIGRVLLFWRLSIVWPMTVRTLMSQRHEVASNVLPKNAVQAIT